MFWGGLICSLCFCCIVWIIQCHSVKAVQELHLQIRFTSLPLKDKIFQSRPSHSCQKEAPHFTQLTEMKLHNWGRRAAVTFSCRRPADLKLLAGITIIQQPSFNSPKETFLRSKVRFCLWINLNLITTGSKYENRQRTQCVCQRTSYNLRYSPRPVRRGRSTFLLLTLQRNAVNQEVTGSFRERERKLLNSTRTRSDRSTCRCQETVTVAEVTTVVLIIVAA